jgi:hypothetical protein
MFCGENITYFIRVKALYMISNKTTTMVNFNECFLKLYYPSYTYKAFKCKYCHLSQMIECCKMFITIIICLLKPAMFIS